MCHSPGPADSRSSTGAAEVDLLGADRAAQVVALREPGAQGVQHVELGGPLDAAFFQRFMDKFVTGGFCTREELEAIMAMPDGGVMLNDPAVINACAAARVEQPNQWEHPNDFNHWHVTNNGGSFEWLDVQGMTIPGPTPASHVGGMIQRFDLKTGQLTTLYTECDGKRLVGPNDLVFDRQGGFWFTDHGCSTPDGRKFGALYYAKVDGSHISRQRDHFVSPNGVGLSPDERVVYMADTNLGRLWAFDVAEPGVLGVSATSALAAATAIVLGLAAIPGAVESAALFGAAVGGGLLIALAARVRAPEALILFGVALSSFAGALTALIFNLSPSPIASAEVMNWLLGSVENRSWNDVAWVAPALLIAGLLARGASPGLRMLTLGEEAARASGLSMGRMRVLALAASALAAGAAVAVAGVIGFVGLAAPHLVRAAVRGDPGRLLAPSALAGGLMLVVADLMARMLPTDQELKLGVFTALVGAPLFALIAWRAAREWRL